MHVQMARELGINPNKFGKLANHRQEPWKVPLPDFIARIYIKRFGKMPDVVKTVEEVAAAEMAKRGARRLRKRAATGDPGSSEALDEHRARTLPIPARPAATPAGSLDFGARGRPSTPDVSAYPRP